MNSTKLWRWTIAVAIVLALIGLGAKLAEPAATSYTRSALLKGLQKDYETQVGDLQVRLFPGVHVTIRDLVLHQKDRPGAPPLIETKEVSVSAGWTDVIRKHVGEVVLTGLKIQVPPRRASEQPHHGSSKIAGFVIDTIIADGTILEVYPKDPEKEPLGFEIHQLTLHGAGPDQPMTFQATLRNARPPGEIHSSGKFGPWEAEEPAATPVSGSYTFRDADLSVFKGIAGTLSSDGSYQGVLDHISVQGKTDTPDFTVRISGRPVHLTTQFQAVVDGTSGNTYLDPVNGQFGRSSLVARGSVAGERGKKGKTVALDVSVKDGRLEDMLRLAVKPDTSTNDSVMTGAISFHTKLVIAPGDVDIAQKLRLDGAFEVGQAHFSELNVQEKVNSLSHRGKGDPKESPDASVASDFNGSFKLDNGIVTFPKLSFNVPGISVALSGNFGLLDQHLDLHGTARLEAKLSQTTTGVKSFLLKAVDPFFEKKNAGAVIPIEIGGTSSSPKFGLDIGGHRVGP